MTGTGLSPEALLASIVENSDDAIISKNLDGVVMSWNRGAEELFGYAAAEMIGQSIRVLIPEERQQEEDAILRNVVAGRQVRAMNTVRLRKTGAPVRVSITVSPVRDADGRIIGASKIARDVGSLQAARDALVESERRFHMLADNIGQLAWIAESDGSIFWYNKRWFEYTGMTMDETQGWGWTAVHHPDHLDRVVERVRYSLETGEVWEDTFPLLGKDGTYRWFLSRAFPMWDDHGQILCWFGTNTDVTESRAQAKSIEALLDEVNHRAKNMLTVIMALARRSAPGNSDFLKRFVRRIEALAANQDLLVRGSWTSIDVGDLVDAQLAFVRDLVGDSISIDGPQVAINARAAQALGMALHELATNALKYGALSDAEGRVEITWNRKDDRFAIAWREHGGPPVEPVEHSGFGISVIRDIPASTMNAEVALNFAPAGVTWNLSCPMAGIAAD